MKWIKALFEIGAELQQKGWYASKTVWVNILTLIAAVIACKFHGFQIDADSIAAVGMGFAAIGNIGLRFVTKTPIGATTVQSQDSGDQPGSGMGGSDPGPDGDPAPGQQPGAGQPAAAATGQSGPQSSDPVGSWPDLLRG